MTDHEYTTDQPPPDSARLLSGADKTALMQAAHRADVTGCSCEAVFTAAEQIVAARDLAWRERGTTARAERATVRLAAVVEAMVAEYGSFEGHDLWCPKSEHYEQVSDHPRGDRPCDCFAGALRAALADRGVPS